MIDLLEDEITTGCPDCSIVMLHKATRTKSVCCPKCNKLQRGSCGLLRATLLNLVMELMGRDISITEALERLIRGNQISIVEVRADLKEMGVKQCITCDTWFQDMDGCGVGHYVICKPCRRGP